MRQDAAPETIGLSYLNAVEYCPRRFHYEFVQGDMLRNEFVLEGNFCINEPMSQGNIQQRERSRSTTSTCIARPYDYPALPIS